MPIEAAAHAMARSPRWLAAAVVALSAAAAGASVGAAEHPLAKTLRSNLQEIAEAQAKKWDCAVAIAVRGDDGLGVSVASGRKGAGPSSPAATPEDRYAWGSITKMVTGVSIIRLANEGKLSLDEHVAPILDPYFASQGRNITLAGMFGPDADRITIRQLATMRAGVPDFDTAKPDEHNVSKSTDPFRAHVYANPSKDWSPYDLLALPWVSSGHMEFPPGTDQDYSSTNFILLGLVIAAKHSVVWDRLDQAAFRPPATVRAGLLNHSAFAAKGGPPEYTDLDAFDRTSYNGHNASALPGTSVRDVHGVFGGWTASDIVAPVQDIADLAYDIYGPKEALVTRENVTMMTNYSSFYGFATFLISDFTGMPADVPAGQPNYGTCYGHLGATYGWNSVALFTPGTNLSISVASNIETNEQATPSEVYCLAYNRVRQIVTGEPVRDCHYIASGYFGECVCPGTRYACMRDPGSGFGFCKVSYKGNVSYEDCTTSC